MESALRVMNKATALSNLAQFNEGRNASHPTPATPPLSESPSLERAIPAV